MIDIKHIIAAIAVTSMGVAYCELPPIPEDMEVYDAEREGISYAEEEAAGRAPSPTDYEAADKLLLKINPTAYTSDSEEMRDFAAKRRIARIREKKGYTPQPRWVKVY